MLLTILLLLEILLRLGNPVDALKVRTVDLWGVPPRLQICRRRSPQAVLLGSSLMLVLNEEAGNKHIPISYDPSYLRSLLSKATGQEITPVNLATGGQMVSEAYLLAEAACNTRRPPAVIIYGVSLRDFVHGRLLIESQTESFKSVAPYVPISAVDNIYTKMCRPQFVACHYSYLWRNRTDFLNLFSCLAKQCLENLPLDQPFVKLGSDCTWHAQKDGYLLETFTRPRQEVWFDKMLLEHPDLLKSFFRDFQLDCYQIQDNQTADVSYHYFKCLQDLCRRKNILLIVVNMPLSPELMSVVPADRMQKFRDYLHKGELPGSYCLIDLWADKRFADCDFKDGEHLTIVGMRKFADILVQRLEKDFPAVVDRLADQAAGKN
jgi:hypothetical protein